MTDKIKVFFDTNIYDELIKLSTTEWELIKEHCEICTCDVVKKELDDISEKKLEKKNSIQQLQNNTKFKNLKFFGFCTYNNPNPNNLTGLKSYQNPSKEGKCFIYNDGKYYSKVKNNLDYGKKKPKGKDNNNDAFIATIANKEKCIVVTHDGVYNNVPQTDSKKFGLYQAINTNGAQVMTLIELLEYLNSIKI